MRKIFKSDRKEKKEKVKKTVDKDIHLNLIGVPIANVNVDKKLEREQKNNYHMYRISIDTSRDQKERKSSLSPAPPQPSSNTRSKNEPLRMVRVNIIPSDSSSSDFIDEPRSVSKSLLRKPTTSTKKTDQPNDNQDVCYTEEQRPPVRIVGRLKTPDDNNGKERRNSTKRKRSKQVVFSDRDAVYGTPDESHTSTVVKNLPYKGADPQVYHLQDEPKAPFTGSELKDDLHPNSSNTSLLQEPLSSPKQMAQLGDDQVDKAGNKDPVPTRGQSPGSKRGIDHKDEPTTSAPLVKPVYRSGTIRSTPTFQSTAPDSSTTDKSIVQSDQRNGTNKSERDLPNSFQSVPMKPEDDKLRYKRMNPEDDKLLYKQVDPEDNKIGYKPMNQEDDKIGYKQVKPKDDKIAYKQMKPEDDKIGYKQMNPEDDKIGYKHMNPEDDKIGYKQMNPEDDKIGYKQMNPEDDKIGYKQMNPEDDKIGYKQMNPEDNKIGYKQMNPEDDKLGYEQINVPSKASKRSDERYAEVKPQKILDKEPEKIPSFKKRITDSLPASKPVRFFDRFSKKQPVMVGNKVLHFETQPAFNEEGTDGPDRKTYDSKDPSNTKPRMQDAMTGSLGTIGSTKEFGNQASTQSKNYLPKTGEQVMADVENVPNETNAQRMIPKAFPKIYSKDSTGSKKETVDKLPKHERSIVPQLVTTIPKPSFKSTKSNFILGNVSKNVLPRDVKIPNNYERKLGVNESTSYDAIPGVNENVMTDFPSTNDADNNEEPVTKHPNSFSVSREGFRHPSTQDQLNRVESRSVEMYHRTYGDSSSVENQSDEVPVYDSRYTVKSQPKDYPRSDYGYQNNNELDGPNVPAYKVPNETGSSNSGFNKQPILGLDEDTQARIGKTGAYAYPTYSATPSYRPDDQGASVISNNGLKEGEIPEDEGIMNMFKSDAKPLNDTVSKKMSVDESFVERRINQNHTDYNPDYVDPSNIPYPSTSNYVHPSTLELQREKAPLSETLNNKPTFGDGKTGVFAVSDIGVNNPFSSIAEQANPVDNKFTGKRSDAWSPDVANSAVTKTGSKKSMKGSHPHRQQNGIPIGKGGWISQMSVPTVETIKEEDIDAETSIAPGNLDATKPLLDKTGKYYEKTPTIEEHGLRDKPQVTEEPTSSKYSEDDDTLIKKSNVIAYMGDVNSASPFGPTAKEEGSAGNEFAGKVPETKPKTGAAGSQQRIPRDSEVEDNMERRDLFNDTHNKPNELTTDPSSTDSDQPDQNPQDKEKRISDESQETSGTSSGKRKKTKLKNETPKPPTTTKGTQMSPDDNSVTPKKKRKSTTSQDSVLEAVYLGKVPNTSLNVFYSPDKENVLLPEDNDYGLPDDGRQEIKKTDSCRLLTEGPSGIVIFVNKKGENYVSPFEDPGGLSRNSLNGPTFGRPSTEGDNAFQDELDRISSSSRNKPGSSKYDTGRSSSRDPSRLSGSSRKTSSSSKYGSVNSGRSRHRDPSRLSGSSRKTSSSSKYDSVSSGKSRPGDLNRARSKSPKKSRKGKQGLDDQSSLSSKRRKRSPRSKSNFEKEGDLTKLRRKYPCGCVRITKLDRNNELVAEELMSVYCRDGSQCKVRNPELQKHERRVSMEGSFRSIDSHKRSTFPEIEVVSDGIISRRPIEPRPPKPTMRGAPLTGTLNFKSNKLNGVCNLYLQPKLKDYLRDNLHVLKELLERDDRHQSKHS